MTCIRTGFHAFVEPYGLWIYGDAFAYPDQLSPHVLLFRVCETGREPLASRKHFTIHKLLDWFDQGAEKQGGNSTLLCRHDQLDRHGYEGIPCGS